MTRIPGAGRLLIMGLDGVPVELVRRYTADGTMPFLKELLAGNGPVAMRVSLPEVSAVSWSGFMTGRDSGYHGVFGFTDLQEGGYALRFPDFRDLRVPPFFMQMPGARDRAVVMNLPATYPALPLRGVLISGFAAPDLNRAVWPPEMLPRVRSSGYVVDVDCSRAHRDPGRFFSDLHTTLRQRLAFALELMRREEWKLFLFTITGTDRLHHFFFNAWDQEDHPRGGDFRDYYREVDQALAVLVREASRSGPVQWLALSDHGFAKLKTEVNLNPLLRDWGFAGDEPADPDGTTVPVTTSRAFVLDPSRLYIHDRKRFPLGTVPSSRRRALLAELTEALLALRYNGEAVIAAVHRREDIYGPPCRRRAPDLVLQPAPGFDLKAGFTRREVFTRGHFRGAHQWDNAFIAASHPALIPRRPTIFQVRAIAEKMLKSSH